MTTLAEKVLAIEAALAQVPHAFGGALALAYYAEPRATVDIDLNVFVDVADAAIALDPLRRLGVDTSAIEPTLRRDGQGRTFWEGTPVDLFFAYDPFHHAAAAATRVVPFGTGTIPILSADHLVVCKTVFDRAKDWVDIDAMLDLGTPLDRSEIFRWTARIVGDTDPRYERIVAVLTGR